MVSSSPDPPEVTDPQTVYLEEGEPIDLVLYATDADGDTLTYTLCQEPARGVRGAAAATYREESPRSPAAPRRTPPRTRRCAP